jgi:Dyp-type peroxidase family
MGEQIFLDSGSILVNEREIQGDVLVGLQKKAELFLFFSIDDPAKFKAALRTFIPNIANTEAARKYEEAATKASAAKKAHRSISHSRDLQLVLKTNIAFSAAGLQALGISHAGADPSFEAGMEDRAAALGDRLADWRPAYRNRQVHGVFLVAAWDSDIDDATTMALNGGQGALAHFGASIREIAQEVGSLNRTHPGHEVFGFADGVSQPAVEGLHKPVTATDQSFPGQDIVALGDFVLGPFDQEKGGQATPPQPWMENGSYMVFRRLRQDVAAFNAFTQKHFKGRAESAEEFAAKLVGRWKDGSPLARDPVQPNAAHDENHPFENNDFEFGVQKVAQTRCPFNAHIRRVYPRSDVQDGVGNAEHHRLLRAGIAYDNSRAEAGDEGLLFVCYQSSIKDKFDFIQTAWANNQSIPFVPPYDSASTGTLPPEPGIDLIIGQAPIRSAVWDGDVAVTDVPVFVTSTGGEYFFMPSMSGLGTIAG